MKYLRKFATEAEYTAFLNGGYVTPNVSLVGKSVEYTKIIGVFIQHINGQLFTSEEWDANGYSAADANGVAVCDPSMQFVVAKSYFTAAWSSNTSELVEGISTTDSAVDALKDARGKENTMLMLATDTSGSAYLCNEYIFPNGKRGYLPSAAEWSLVKTNATEVNRLLSKIGGGYITESKWTSTQYDAGKAWGFYWYNGKASMSTKATKQRVRPFTTL